MDNEKNNFEQEIQGGHLPEKETEIHDDKSENVAIEAPLVESLPQVSEETSETETIITETVETVGNDAQEQLINTTAEEVIVAGEPEQVAVVEEPSLAEPKAEEEAIETVAEPVRQPKQFDEKNTAASGHKRIMQGKVSSNKMDKTIVVTIERHVKHPLYKKYYKRSKKLMAHDEENTCQIGDIVKVREHKPISALKRWEMIEIVERAK